MAENFNLAKLAQRLQDLESKYSLLESERDFLRGALKVFGIEGHWISPAKAALLLGCSRDRIMGDINLAEDLRIRGKVSDMTYGIHYRNDQSPNVGQATWKVNMLEYPKVFQIPPELRKAV